MLKQEGFDLMGAAFEVYNVVGYGMAEEIYQQGWKLNSDRGPSRTVARRTLSWRMGPNFAHRLWPDLLVFNEIVVELKAVKTLAPEHEAQLFNCMRISQKKVDYLINFGASEELEWKRFAL